MFDRSPLLGKEIVPSSPDSCTVVGLVLVLRRNPHGHITQTLRPPKPVCLRRIIVDRFKAEKR